jgi:hypothetical protein
LEETTDLERNKEKLIVSCTENMGYSITRDKKSCQLNMISECNSKVNGGVTYGCISYTPENDKSVYEAVGLLKRAQIKYSKINFNSTVEDVPRFVTSFNEKIPEYERRLGYTTVLEEAEKLYKWGQL